jgi:hypothetical protein
MWFPWLLSGSLVFLGSPTLEEQLSPQKFERVVIDSDFPGGYQVEVADVNGDKKQDIVALGGSTLAWYENPTWKKRVVSTSKETPDIISSATADLDGDGKAEIAIAYDFSMNEPRRGKLLLAVQGATVDDPWTFKPVVEPRRETGGGFAGGGIGGASTGAVGYVINPFTKKDETSRAEPSPALPPGSWPSIHRLRWGYYPAPIVGPGSVKFEKQLNLIVAPLFGPSAKPPVFDQEAPSLFALKIDPKSGQCSKSIFQGAPVLHSIEVLNLDDNGFATILAASNQGVTITQLQPMSGVVFGPSYITTNLVSGAPGNAPKKGSSEVHLGRLKDGRKFLATVEPWHGTDVVIYNSESLKPLKFGPRNVIDTTLKEGHALWVADVDGDGDDEVFAGYRGGEGGVLMFDFDGKTWNRTVLDPGVTAQDLRGGDIDGDGTPDIVAIGGKSHNIVWYRPMK